ncbi:MAG: hypothetical protein J6Y54_00895, partial [Lentisphaeria bacterium]|nr:hypothetical protein [Lentisphaeria bacterium]
MKDGTAYDDKGIVVGNLWHSNPTPEMMRAAGWGWVDEEPKFAEVKAAFWELVDEAAAALSEATGQEYTRADFPTGAFSPELLAWCAQHGMSEAQTGALAVKFCGIAADLARLGRNWNELFDE